MRHWAPTRTRAVSAPPATMRGIVETAAGLEVAEIPTPVPVGDEVLVRVHAAGVCGTDAGTLADPTSAAPSTPGLDVAGVVVRAPYDAHPLAVGTEVHGIVPYPRVPGAYAEYAVVPSGSLAVRPDSLSLVEAAAVPVAGLSAWQAVVEVAQAHRGQRILVHDGASGIGHLAVQIAAYLGAHVTTTASGAGAAWMRELGADVVVDTDTTRFEDVLPDVDVVIDPVGDRPNGAGSRSLDVLRPGGLLIAMHPWASYAHDAEGRGIRATDFRFSPDGQTLATLGRLLDDGSIRVFVDSVLPLADAATAHARFDEGHTRGRIVLSVTA
ncbi:NADP-dependent oxidoreductase [Microbacterium sp. CBS5P-1]|nr:NADP-dependent oxidoreductase [Microbacterium excoecariae]